MIHQVIAAVKPIGVRSVRRWLFHLGGVGLIPLGLLDSSIIPLPGSMDIVTIVLASRDAQLWFYYAVMATLGSVAGGVVTYRLARKGGKAALERRLSRRRANQMYKVFEKWGFGTVTISSLLPPPAPMVPFLVTAGAMQYPARKFAGALTLGRAVRYTVLAYLGARYGREIIHFVAGHPITWGVVGLIILGALAIAIMSSFSRMKREKATAT